MKEYSTEDWVVHSFYGIGQIQGVEVKGISGEETRYYKIRTADSTYWMPVDQMDSDLIRWISNEEDIETAVAVLKRQPREMSSNHQTRNSRIRRTRLRNTPIAVARLIRDLRAHQLAKGKLNQNEKSAFDLLKKRFTEEWAIATGSGTRKVANKLEQLLKQQEPLTE